MGTQTSRELRRELDNFAEAIRAIHADLKELLESDLASEAWLTDSEDGDYATLALKKLDLAADFLTSSV